MATGNITYNITTNQIQQMLTMDEDELTKLQKKPKPNKNEIKKIQTRIEYLKECQKSGDKNITRGAKIIYQQYL